MNTWLFLIPISLGLGVVGLVAFFWSIRNHQYEDMDGAAYRILDEDNEAEVEQK